MPNNRQTRYLRSLAHSLKPVVRVGSRGVTAAVCRELDHALTAHELLKVKVEAGDRSLREAAIAALCEHSGAELIQRVGNVAVLYRRNDRKPVIELP